MFVAIGAVLFAADVGNRRRAWLPTAGGLAALAGSVALGPQTLMHGSHDFAASAYMGFGLYFAAAILLVWAALRLYAPVRPAPATLTLSGLVFADPNSWMISRLFFLARTEPSAARSRSRRCRRRAPRPA